MGKPVRVKIPITDKKEFEALPKEAQAEYMTPEEQEAYDTLPEIKRREYDLKVDRQKAEDELKALRDAQAVNREKIKVEKEKNKAVKALIADIRKDELVLHRDKPLLENADVLTRFKEIGIPEDEQEKLFKRVLEDSVRQTSSRLLPAKPAYELSHSLVMAKKADFIEPTDGGRPDSTLANNLRRKGFIMPLLVAVVYPPTDTPEVSQVKYKILDGKRRFWVMNDEDSYPAVIVTGFPEPSEQEQVEVIVNRVRNLNILSTAETLNDMRTRGVKDTEIRRDMGFKTGEIDKITSIVTLREEFQDALREGAITPNVAIQLAKLPKALRGELAKDYATRKKEDANARISQANVDEMRQRRQADAVSRDNSALSDLAEKTPELEKAADVDKKEKSKVKSKAGSASKKNEKPKNNFASG